MLASSNEWNEDIEDVDAKHSARSSADQQGVDVLSQNGSAARRPPSQAPHTNQPVPRVTATTTLSNREEEEHYLSLPLDPSNVKSILYLSLIHI